MNPHQAFLGRLLAIACLLALLLVPLQAASADPAAAFVRFEATPGPSGIGVVWETASELNTIAFRLYRSLEGSPGDWGVALYVVAAHGDPFSGSTYSYIDTAVVPGTTYYYMLEDIDDGGMATSHAPVAAVAVFGCGAVTEIPQTECEALVALYDRTSGSGWTGSTGWLSTNTPCTWKGVACSNGHVTSIDLGGNQLSGSIPPALGSLANLQYLWLPSNQLTGSIPPELGNLANLLGLDLGDNQLTGSIPPELGSLANLQGLWLPSNQLTGSIPPELGNLVSLQVLHLGDNQLSGSIPPALGNLANLQSLYLSHNQLSGALPRSLMTLSPVTFYFHNTSVCEPPDPAFQAWLASIPALQRTGVMCKLAYVPLVFQQPSSAASFWADRYQVEPGECAGLYWQVANARQVFLDDLEVSPQGTLLVCPSATTTYLLTVVQTNGIKDYHRLAIYVGGDDAWFGVDEDGNFYRGNPNATVKLEEFMDFQCPYCVRHALQTGPLLNEAYIATGEVVEVFRNFPLDFHSGAVPAAKAAYCAGQQKPEFFWSMYDWLVQNQEAWNQDSEPSAQFRAAALRLGVDVLRYDACLAHVATEAHIQGDIQEGSNRGVRGVPAFFINSCSLSGALPFENFRDTIEKAKQGLCTPGVQFFDIDPARPGFTIDGSPTRGAANARVVLISYEDFKTTLSTRRSCGMQRGWS